MHLNKSSWCLLTWKGKKSERNGREKLQKKCRDRLTTNMFWETVSNKLYINGNFKWLSIHLKRLGIMELLIINSQKTKRPEESRWQIWRKCGKRWQIFLLIWFHVLNSKFLKTLEQRAKSQKLKEKRKQMLAARLAKVKERKNLRTSDDGKIFVFHNDLFFILIVHHFFDRGWKQ